MMLKDLASQRLGKHIADVEVGGDVLDDDDPICDIFAHFELPARDVPRPLRDLALPSKLFSAGVVIVGNRQFHLRHTKVAEDFADVRDLGGHSGCGHDFHLSGRERDELLPLAGVGYRTPRQGEHVAGG